MKISCVFRLKIRSSVANGNQQAAIISKGKRTNTVDIGRYRDAIRKVISQKDLFTSGKNALEIIIRIRGKAADPANGGFINSGRIWMVARISSTGAP